MMIPSVLFSNILTNFSTSGGGSGGITTTSLSEHPGCIIQVDEGVLHHDVVLETISHEFMKPKHIEIYMVKWKTYMEIKNNIHGEKIMKITNGEILGEITWNHTLFLCLL